MDVLDTLNSLQDAVEQEQLKSVSDKPQFEFDKLKMYFGEDYDIKGIKISIPMIGDILNIGEKKFYSAISPFLNNPTSSRVMLYDNFKKDWNKTKDIEVFYILFTILKDKEPLKLLFKNLDFSEYKLVKIPSNSEDENCFVLLNSKTGSCIDEMTYLEIAEFIRTMMNSHPKVEKAKGKTTKHWMLQEDRMKATQKEKDKDKEGSSILLPLVSSCVNHPGFKYKLEELKQVNIYQFMDSVNRIQKYEQGVAAMSGIYSGFVSSKDIPKDLINFMGEL